MKSHILAWTCRCYWSGTDASDKGDKKFDDKVNNYLRFMMDNFPTEMTVMGARTAITNYNLPFQPNKLAHFKEFFDRFGKYVVKAMED